jgi:hypothetical protein
MFAVRSCLTIAKLQGATKINAGKVRRLRWAKDVGGQGGEKDGKKRARPEERALVE